MRHKHAVRSGTSTTSTSIRDRYGFEVKKDMLSQYQNYAPLWEKEEVERSERWDAFLAHFETAYYTDIKQRRQGASPLDLLEQACQSWPPGERGVGHNSTDWQHQLRSLVQAGIPMTLRGKMWHTFLGLEAVKKEGYYEQLVLQALGSKYSKHKDRHLHDELADTFSAPPQDEVSVADTVGSPAAAQAADQAEVAEMVDAAEAALVSLAPQESPAGPAASSPKLEQASQASRQGSEVTQSDAGFTQVGSQLLSLSSESLSALPTPLHPAAVPPAVAQDLNNALARSLLQGPHASDADDTKPHSVRLTSAYSEAASSELSSKVAVGWHPSSHDWNLQIEKDLHRTFPGHPVMDGTGRSALRRILAAYARRNPSVGYCQGMNFIAGCLLLFMDEEDTFWCLAIIVEELLPGYFSMAMTEPQVDQLVFKELVDDGFPRLSSHLEGHGVNVSSVSTNWFLCIFVNSLPLESCLRVWDIFFLECCSSVLFRVALALVDIYSQALVATTDSVDAFSLLQNMAPMSYDSSRLIDVACISFSSTDRTHLASLQAKHRQTVLAQFSSHGQPEDGDGWASSDANSDAVQRSAHSTPQAGTKGAFSPSASQAPQDADLQVTARSLSAIVTKPKHRQLRIASKGLAGSPKAQVQGDSPHSQASSAAASAWSTVSSPDWHSTPRWPQYANFTAHSSRLANPSMLFRDTSAQPPSEDETQSEAEIVGQPGMAEEEYQAAAAQTAQLAAQLPRIGVAARPTPGPSMPQRMINRFRNQEAVLGEHLRKSLPRASSGLEPEPHDGEVTHQSSIVSSTSGMLPPAGTPTPSPSPAALHPAAWGVHRARQHAFLQPASPMQPPAPPSTPQAAADTQAQSSMPSTPDLDTRATEPSAGPAPAVHSVGNVCQTSAQDAAAVQASTSGSTTPVDASGQQADLSRVQSDAEQHCDTDIKRHSDDVHSHSALSRMLEASSLYEQAHLGDGCGGWTLSAGNVGQHVAPGNSPDSAALQQLLHVVEGLEEELFSSEARRNDAETQAEALRSSVQDLQSRLAQARGDLCLKQQMVQGLTSKFDRGAVALGEADARLADKQVAVAAAKAQLAAHDKHLMSQDATIAKLMRKQGQSEGLGAAFLRNIHFPFRRGKTDEDMGKTTDEADEV